MIINTTRARLLAAFIGIAGFVLPLAASAQDIPSYAQSSSVNSDETITGRIASIDGTFNITVNDERGYADSVALYQGTIINPTGLTLESGMDVTIQGYADGSAFVANEIDTPYQISGPVPAPAYYGPGWWYPGFAYGFGPAFSLNVVFGGGNAWHAEQQQFHGRPWSDSAGHAYGAHPVTFAPPARRAVEPAMRAPAPQMRAQQPMNPVFRQRAPMQGSYPTATGSAPMRRQAAPAARGDVAGPRHDGGGPRGH